MAQDKLVEAKKGGTWAETAGTGGRKGAWGISGTLGSLVAYFGTILLVTLCPAITILMWFALTRLDGSFRDLYEFGRAGGLKGLLKIYPVPSFEAWKIIASFGLFEAALQLYMPGKEYLGPKSPKGNTPVYKANGLQSYAASLLAFFFGWRKTVQRELTSDVMFILPAMYIFGIIYLMRYESRGRSKMTDHTSQAKLPCRFGLFDPARVYDLFGEILSALSLFSFVLCIFLVYKGIKFPSTSDNGSNDSFVYDFFWGRELYPRLGEKFDIKTWTNCRMGMMSWAILPLCYIVKQQQLFGEVQNSILVSVALMEIYCFKFFLWETGYWNTMDIAHDRAGYYLCWGCLNWVPAIYTSQPLLLAKNPYHLPTPYAAAIFIAGVACVYINYDCDRQRQVFRASSGQKNIWGKKPQYVIAKYTSGKGTEDTSLLLTSGWWGVSRHFHYVPEILAAVFWTLPAGNHPLVWFYVVFLTLLLTDRSFRDDQRCLSKYGSYWNQYCQAVPYRLIPYVY